MKIQRENEPIFKLAIKTIYSMSAKLRTFQVKEVVQASKQFVPGGQAVPEWVVRRTLDCLEANGYYSAIWPSKRAKFWTFCGPDGFLERKLGDPIEEAFNLILKREVATTREKLDEHFLTMPTIVRESPAHKLITMLDAAKHMLAVRSLEVRLRLDSLTVRLWIDQWVYVDIVRRVEDYKGPAIQKTSQWDPSRAAEALLRPRILMPAVRVAERQLPGPPILLPPLLKTIEQVEQKTDLEHRELTQEIEHQRLTRLIARQDEIEAMRRRLGISIQ